MKGLTQFLFESIINEGGHAVEGTPMTQPQARAVYDDVVGKFIKPVLGLSGEGCDFSALGSFGKKEDDKTSGDIDIAVSTDVIASRNNITLEEVEPFIIKCLEKEGIKYKNNRGIYVISLSWPIPGTDNFGQVDIMPTTNLDFTKWMYYSPDFRMAESRYKGLYRNQLIMSILSFADRKVIRRNDNGDVIEYERYSLRLNQGLARTRRSFEGKKGGLLKNARLLKEYDAQVTNVPNEIVKIAFGEGVAAGDVMTFEQAYALFMGDKFPHSRERDRIIEKFVEALEGVAPVPEEVAKDFKLDGVK